MDLAQENEIFRQKSFFEKVGMVDKKKQKKIIIDTGEKIKSIFFESLALNKRNRSLKFELNELNSVIQEEKNKNQKIKVSLDKTKQEYEQSKEQFNAQLDNLFRSIDHLNMLVEEQMGIIRKEEEKFRIVDYEPQLEGVERIKMAIEDLWASIYNIQSLIEAATPANLTQKKCDANISFLQDYEENLILQLDVLKKATDKLGAYLDNIQTNSINMEIEEAFKEERKLLERFILSLDKFKIAATLDINELAPYEREKRTSKSPYK